MFSKNFANHHKKLLHLLKFKSLSEKGLLQIANKKIMSYMLIDLKENSRFDV